MATPTKRDSQMHLGTFSSLSHNKHESNSRRGQSVEPRNSQTIEAVNSQSNIFSNTPSQADEARNPPRTPSKQQQTVLPSVTPLNLPQISSAQKQQPILNTAKFQKMVYNRNFVLNIDNELSSQRVNHHYISNYYQQLTEVGILPTSLTNRSLPSNDIIGHGKSITSATSEDETQKFTASAMKARLNRLKNLNDDSLMSEISKVQESRKLNLGQTTSRELSLPPLAGDSIIANLNLGIQLTAKQKAIQLMDEMERHEHRKDFTKDLIGMQDFDSQNSSVNNFKAIGSLENNMDSKSEVVSQQSHSNSSYIESAVFRAAEENPSEYRDFLIQKSQEIKLEKEKAEKSPIRGDNMSDLGRSSISSEKYHLGSEFDQVIEKEPERDFGKLRAKIKLISLKRYEEDEKTKQDEEKAKIAALNSSEGMEALKKRKKHAPIKRKLSFTDVQLKFNDINDLWRPEKDESGEPSLYDKLTIDKMMKAKRYPVPEKLMNEPEGFNLNIDSIIHGIYNVEGMINNCDTFPSLRAPKNSDVSADNVTASESSETEVDEDGNPIQKKKLVVMTGADKIEKKFDKKLIEFQGFKLDAVAVFPHKARDGEVPIRLLRIPRIDNIPKVSQCIADQQKEAPFTLDEIQSIFEYYCIAFKVQYFDIKRFIMPADNERTKFSIKQQTIDENTVKAIVMTMPFIHGIYEVEFINNFISDMMSSLVLMSCFLNPSVVRINYVSNYAKINFNKTLCALMKGIPAKIKELNTGYSIHIVEVMDQIMRNFINFEEIVKLNMSGCSFSVNACRVMNAYLLKHWTLKDLNLSRCKISNQGTRYIIDAINRNVTIRHLNLAYNDLSSSIYEFSIKFASTLTRHPTLMHADITQCGLKREESMFIILAMSTSKNFLSLHITANDLPYYERVFMRSLIAARVQFAFKGESQKPEIKFNKERNQIMTMATGDHIQDELKHYLETFDQLDKERRGLDFEIEDLIKEMDLEKYYNSVQNAMKLEDINPDSKLGKLIRKIRERAEEINKQQEAIQTMMKVTGPSIRERIEQLSGLKNTTDLIKQAGSPKSANNPDQAIQEAFDNQNEMRVERQRQRAELETVKAQKERSAGELALLFMGINQVAYELLIENPMTGYMNEIIFSRILGHDDLEQGNYWCDTTQCYICAKWEKFVIQFDPRVDGSKWAQKITQIDRLKYTVDTLIHNAEEAERVHKAGLDMKNNVQFEDQGSEDAYYNLGQNATVQNMRAVFKKTNYLPPGTRSQLNLEPTQDGQGHETVYSQRLLKAVGPDILAPKFGGTGGISPKESIVQSRKAATFDQQNADLSPRSKAISQVDGGVFSKALDQAQIGEEPKLEREDTPKEKVQRPLRQEYNTENPMNPKKLTITDVQNSIFVDNFKNANDFEELNLHESPPGTPEEGQRVAHGQHDKYMHTKQMTRFGGIAPRDFKPKQPSVKDLASLQIKQNEQKFQKKDTVAPSVAPSFITTSVQNFGEKRIRGQPQKIQRTLFFQGMVYVIEEEVYSDSENSSVYSSEDEFETDKGLSVKFVSHLQDYRQKLWDTAEEKRLELERGPKKTEKDLRREKLGIQEDHTKLQLTQAQKEYRTKIWPKHYVPILKDYKSQQLDLIGRELELKVNTENPDETPEQTRKRKKNEKVQIHSGPLADTLVVYLVASFNDWMPIKMKTKRELIFEKLNPDEPIPKATFVLDNIVQLYANYIPPGAHFFYFVKQDGTIFLSPKYDVVRFKTTKIFLNRIVQLPRKFDFDTVHAVKGGDDQEEVFIKDRSVFRDFRDDTKPYLRKCFEQDMIYSKILRAVKGDVDIFEDIQLLLFKHYVKLINIHLFYIGTSSYPTISMNDFTSWANKCNMVDGKWINLAALDRILITTNVALHGLISSAERDLNRYEFLEIIVRLATALYKESKICNTIPEAILKLLNENIYPNSKEVNGEHFRRFHCYNVKVNEILKKNETVIKKVYDLYTHSKKKFIRLDECRELVRKAGLNVSDLQCGPIYAESMCTIIDTISDQTRPQQMKYVEFLVFICRISYEHYRGTPYENEMMHLKIEHTLPMYLSLVGAQPAFLFNEQFEYKPAVKKAKKVKKIVVKKKKDSSASSSSSTESKQESEPEESSSEDDLGEVVVLEDGKFKLSQPFIDKMAREKIEKAERRKLREEAKAKAEAEKAAKEAERLAKLEKTRQVRQKIVKYQSSEEDFNQND